MENEASNCRGEKREAGKGETELQDCKTRTGKMILQTDGQTDRQTERRTALSLLYRVCIPCSAVNIRCFGLHYCRRKFSIFSLFYRMDPKSTEFGEITQHNGHYVLAH